MTYIITVGLIGLFMLGIPIAMSLGLIGLIAFFVEQGSRMNVPMIAQRMMSGINNFVLLAVPLFLLSARLMNTSGVTTRLFIPPRCRFPSASATQLRRASSSPGCPGAAVATPGPARSRSGHGRRGYTMSSAAVRRFLDYRPHLSPAFLVIYGLSAVSRVGSSVGCSGTHDYRLMDMVCLRRSETIHGPFLTFRRREGLRECLLPLAPRFCSAEFDGWFTPTSCRRGRSFRPDSRHHGVSRVGWQRCAGLRIAPGTRRPGFIRLPPPSTDGSDANRARRGRG
jgi:hypothetical protein